MAFTKTWEGATSATYTDDTNWQPISIRNGIYKWTVSGSGTAEYHLELIGGGNPGVSTPGHVLLNGASVTSGSLGSLAAGHYGYGDNDTLGYSTIYVRLADGTDPDTKVRDYVQFTQVPLATDNVRIPAGAGAIDGVDQSGVAINEFVVEDGYAGTIGDADYPLIIDPDAFRFAGQGLAYIDLFTAAISPQVFKTGPAGTGLRGLYLTGSALVTLNVMGGAVGLAVRSGETSSLTTARVVGRGADLWLGKGVTLTTMYQTDGKSEQRCASTTTTVYGGTLYTKEVGAVTTLNVRGGQVFAESTGTITTVNLDGGVTDFTTSGAARTVTTLKVNPGATARIDPAILTVTTRSAPDYPETINASAV